MRIVGRGRLRAEVPEEGDDVRVPAIPGNVNWCPPARRGDRHDVGGPGASVQERSAARKLLHGADVAVAACNVQRGPALPPQPRYEKGRPLRRTARRMMFCAGAWQKPAAGCRCQRSGRVPNINPKL